MLQRYVVILPFRFDSVSRFYFETRCSIQNLKPISHLNGPVRIPLRVHHAGLPNQPAHARSARSLLILQQPLRYRRLGYFVHLHRLSRRQILVRRSRRRRFGWYATKTIGTGPILPEQFPFLDGLGQSMMQSLGQTQAGQSADHRYDAKNYEGQHQVFFPEIRNKGNDY